MRRTAVAFVLFAAYGCATTAPPPQQKTETLRGIASWYGQEFAGRTTANGEIFDPMLLTAAHRTLPFGTIADVKNPSTGQMVRVRINDRGPYVGNRMIDLSYAAAQQLSLIEPGSGEVEVLVVKLGSGDREPPAPYVVTVATAPKVDIPTPAPLPAPAPVPAIAPTPEENDFRVEVQEQRGTQTPQPVRRRVSADGKTIEMVPVDGAAPPPALSVAPAPSPARAAGGATPRPPTTAKKGFVVQVGAFSVESNAVALQQRLTRIGQKSHIERDDLFRVRIGPFATRDEAIRARSSLEASGISAIVMAQ